MINISFYREIKGHEFIKEMESKYKTMNVLEDKIKEDNNPLDMVDLENWKIFEKDPEQRYKELVTHFPEKIHTMYIDFDLLSLIKKEKPSTLKELAQLTNSNIYDVTEKVEYLKSNGLIELDNNMPIVNYDKIEIAI